MVILGLMKPHLPFNAPERYWSMYEPSGWNLSAAWTQVVDSKTTAATRRLPSWSWAFTAPTGGEPWRFGQGFTDSSNGSTVFRAPPNNPFGLGAGVPGSEMCVNNKCETRSAGGRMATIAQQTSLLHGYLACVSYADALIGRVMNAIPAAAANNTLIVLTSDHGFHLGDHGGFWSKHTVFDQATRVPLVFAAPWLPDRAKGRKASAGVAELVDVYPTLRDIVTRRVPGALDSTPVAQLAEMTGVSLVPVLNDPSISVKTVARSQWPKRVKNLDSSATSSACTVSPINNFDPGAPYSEACRAAIIEPLLADQGPGMGWSIRVHDQSADLSFRVTEWWLTNYSGVIDDADYAHIPILSSATAVEWYDYTNSDNMPYEKKNEWYRANSSFVVSQRFIDTVMHDALGPSNGGGDGWARLLSPSPPRPTPPPPLSSPPPSQPQELKPRSHLTPSPYAQACQQSRCEASCNARSGGCLPLLYLLGAQKVKQFCPLNKARSKSRRANARRAARRVFGN